MAFFDVFNGDADGLCALVQLRLAEPREATLVTGVKRDIDLLRKVQAGSGDEVTVLDVSLDKNRDDLQRILEKGARVFYADHHFAGDIPESPQLTTLINPAADVCTALIVNGFLQGQFAGWAVVGAFGDNLRKSAQALAKQLDVNAAQLERMEQLGIYMNYNGYGASPEDLHFRPEELYRQIAPFADPLDFIAGNAEAFGRLETGYQEDMAAAAAVEPELSLPHAAAFVLPNAAWARRVSGVYSNELANEHPDRAHAVLTEKANGNYLISVRAPINNKTGADELCRQFPTGGGRAAAAGVNDLPADQLQSFLDALAEFYR